MGKPRYIVMDNMDKLERLNLILAARLRNAEIFGIENSAGRYKGLWYKINEEALDLTIRFYEKEIGDKGGIIGYYNRFFGTDKFEAYIKKNISSRVFNLLKNLHLLKVSGIGSDGILMVRNPIDEFVVEYMKERYGIGCEIRWVYPVFGACYLILYYKWLVLEFIRRGIVFNRPAQAYKLSKEAVWGFHRHTCRDDIMIDNDKFKPDDLLLLDFEINEPHRVSAAKEAKKRGFRVVSVPALHININKNIAGLLFFYFFVPIRIYFQSLVKGQSYLFPYISTFHRSSFAIEALMNLYKVKCHIATKDWADVDTTIILNKYGAKSAIFHWSDIAVYKAASHAFAAHNIYFGWGDVYFDIYADTFFVDEKISACCIFKDEYTRALDNKEDIINRIGGIDRKMKMVTFYDTSFSNGMEYSEYFFLEYLEMIEEFCRANKEINVLLKPKIGRYASALSGNNRGRFEKIWNGLTGCANFRYLDPLSLDIGEAIAVSDVCVGMAMNSCTTIALVCGKNALYFDNTGNEHHPFAKKYKNVIMFDDKALLFRQIDRILKGEFNCRDNISEWDIRKFDAFDDNNALGRIRDKLYELTLA